MITEKERQNMVHFLVTYFGVNPNELITITDRMLEKTYEFAYQRLEMENQL
ncbi:BH0509 family protein [Lysinibacillus endophyticus]|uniref:BH0509 family protein n=1 Tax=Ureibacillus endophyticus TaxID=1978490 RepID=A0A494Z7G0_9BACL|nr:BH0509 family protein [Lysinibacillus endophyticus]MCP1145016.1 BH0509 family protein [Lysinibacillus endophyticus]RKQ18443.1 BH0509 family protein [Lysinibacillus endophyticus]